MSYIVESILETAKQDINDEGVFSQDQIAHLHGMIDTIGHAIEKEVECRNNTD